MFRTITPIFSIVIAFVVFFSFTQPRLTIVSNNNGERDEYLKAAEKAQQLSDTLNDLISTKRSHSIQNLENLKVLVPTDIDEVRLLADLSDMAKKRNLLFGNVSLAESEISNDGMIEEELIGDTGSAEVSYSDLIATDISFEIIGTYQQFKALLGDIERSLVLMEVTNITASASEGTLQQFAITVRTYALPVTN